MSEETTKDISRRKKFWEKLKVDYRMVIMRNETFEEVGSYNVTLLSVYTVFSMLFVAIALLVVSLIVFTPVKRYIPGFGEIQEHSEIMKMRKQIDTLETIVQNQALYQENFKKILVGDVEGFNSENPTEAVLSDPAKIPKRVLNIPGSDISFEHLYFSPPITGEISNGFNADEGHLGIDILAPSKTPIGSTLDGRVISADWTIDNGNTIMVQHSNNIVSIYKHNAQLLKKAGDFVKAGEAVAIIGNTGKHTDGPHLHFEVWFNGKAIDPADFVNFN